MPRPDPDFGLLVRWMHDIMVAEGDLGEKLAAARQIHGVDAGEAVIGNNRLPAEARIGIYARGYLLRMLECLRAEFPLLRRLVGEQVFDLFALGYIRARPSRSYSLYDLGAGFADHLRATSPSGGRAGALDSLPASLARLERAQAESSRGRGLEKRPALMVAGLPLMPGLRLRLPETVRLLRLDFDVLPLLAAAEREEELAFPAAGDCLLAVARSHYRVGVHALTPARFAWLEALGTAGEDAHLAVARAAEASGVAAREIIADLFVWLPFAAQAGLVTEEE